MDIVFAGICCWVDARPPKTGKTVIIRNALAGGMHRSVPIPPHRAFIHAGRDDIDSGAWDPYITVGDHVLFDLTGDFITFDPQPSGGLIDVSLLPHVLEGNDADPICPAADEIRPSYRDEPDISAVLALVDVPAEANVYCEQNQYGAMYAVLHVPQSPVTITATPFPSSAGTQRSMTIHNPDARVFLANVTLSDYLNGVPAQEDDHKYLVCDIFRPVAMAARAKRRSAPGVDPTLGPALLANVVRDVHVADMSRVSNDALQQAAARAMSNFLDTLAAGCSDTQWP